MFGFLSPRPLCGWLALMMSRPSWECVLNVGLGMKAVILDMTVDKRWWLQCCLKSDTHSGMQAQARAHTEAEIEWNIHQEMISHDYLICLFLLDWLKHRCFFHVITGKYACKHTSLPHHSFPSSLWRSFILFKAPQWHHGECIGHLTHAPHVSEYISDSTISSQLLKHHVPHRAV